MPARVVDASVLGAWCFQEPRASEALALIWDSDIYAPLLLAYELANIARRKAVTRLATFNVASEALQTALALPILWREVDHGAVLQLAMETNLTTYDASYLYLARVLDVSLITFDQQLARAARELGA